jgi:hypothetical protein
MTQYAAVEKPKLLALGGPAAVLAVLPIPVKPSFG